MAWAALANAGRAKHALPQACAFSPIATAGAGQAVLDMAAVGDRTGIAGGGNSQGGQQDYGPSQDAGEGCTKCHSSKLLIKKGGYVLAAAAPAALIATCDLAPACRC